MDQQPKKSKYKKDYSESDYKNPIAKPKKGVFKNTRTKIYLVLTVFSSAILVYLFIFSPIFVISEVEINTEKSNVASIRDTIDEFLNQNFLLIFPMKNILVFRKNNLKQVLDNKHHLSQVIIKKDFPNKLILDIIDESLIVIKNNNKNYIIDKNGDIEDEITQEIAMEKKYISVDYNTDFQLLMHSNVLTPDKVNKIIAFNDLLQNNSFNVSKYSLEKEFFFIAQLEKYQVRFNLKNNVQKQIDNLVTTNKKLTKDNQMIEYIDLRFNNKIYYQ